MTTYGSNAGTYYEGSDNVNNGDNYNGQGGSDSIYGGAGNDTLDGGAENDFVNGGSGDDKVLGGAGDDTLHGLTGNDTIFGDGEDYGNTNGGRDTIYAGDGNDLVHGGYLADSIFGQDGNDFLYGDHGNDTVSGQYGNDTIVGGAGNDHLYGGGDDTTPGAGERWFDVLNYQQETGNGGVTVSLRDANESLTTSIHNVLTTVHGGRATDTFGHNDTIGGFEGVHGTFRNDILIGSDRDVLESFYTYGGKSYLNGGDGHSRYYIRGDQNSSISGDYGATIVHVGTTIPSRRDVINIGFADYEVKTEGNIKVTGLEAAESNYNHHLVFEALHTGVAVNLGSVQGMDSRVNFVKGAKWGGPHSGNLDFSAADYFLEVEGTHFDDVLIGGNAREKQSALEWYTGNKGDDTIHGGYGDHDTVVYEGENTEYTPGINPVTGVAYITYDSDGNPTSSTSVHGYGVHFANNNGDSVVNGADGVVVVLDDNGNMTGKTNAAMANAYGFEIFTNGYGIDKYGDTDVLLNIDDIRGTSGDDSLTGSAYANEFYGLQGNDTINGGAGLDSAFYRKDVTNPFESSPPPVTGIIVHLENGSTAATVRDGYFHRDDTLGDVSNSSTSYSTDTLISIEHIYATDFADIVTGNNATNLLSGHDGDDSLTGGLGSDTLDGGVGNDTLIGGSGFDELKYEKSNYAIVIDLLGAVDGDGFRDAAHYANRANIDYSQQISQEVDKYKEVEDFSGSQHNDVFKGNSNKNEINGRQGNDILMGRYGNDTIKGGPGDDILYGGAEDLDDPDGLDVFYFYAGWGNDVIKDFEDDRDHIRILNFGINALPAAGSTSDGITVSYVDGNVVIDFGSDTLTIEDITLSNLQDDISF